MVLDKIFIDGRKVPKTDEYLSYSFHTVLFRWKFIDQVVVDVFFFRSWREITVLEDAMNAAVNGKINGVG